LSGAFRPGTRRDTRTQAESIRISADNDAAWIYAYNVPMTKQPNRDLPKSPFPHWLSILLDNPLRRRFVDAAKIVEQAGVAEGQVVLEVGCGPGFFTEFIAQKIGPGGKVIAQEVQPQMLRKLEKRASSFPLTSNITPLLADSGATGLETSSVDLVFAANVFEEIAHSGHMEEAAIELLRVLKPGHRLFFGEHRVPQARFDIILAELAKAGFEGPEKIDTSLFYSAFFIKPA
jgi:arsenite methyltransferase